MDEINVRKDIVESERFLDFLFSKKSMWFWGAFTFSTITPIIFDAIRNNDGFLIIQYILSIIFLLYLPGFSFRRSLFIGSNFTFFERLVFDVVTSLLIVPTVGFILNYTPWGISEYSSTFGLSIVIRLLLIVSVFRAYITQ